MSEAKRGRGRPKGSGARDDTAALWRLAIHILDHQSAEPWPAIRKACGATHDSHIRRLYRKWRAQGSDLLAAERRRRQQAQAALPGFISSQRRCAPPISR
jgi:hypothetical protein